jgi:hypothetical protein
MQPISDLPADEFMRLQAAYGADLPICPVCTLEDVRHVVSAIIFEAPKNAMSEGVRQTLEQVLYVVTGALVSNRAEAEQDEYAAH